MTCASCVRRVERTLGKVPGVEAATVNLATGKATVLHQAEVTSDRLIQAVENGGYTAQEPSSTPAEAIRPSRPWNLIVAAALTVPVFAVSMFWMDRPAWANWLLVVLSTPVVAWSGRQFFVNALKGLRHGAATMDTLVAVGAGVAWLDSLYTTVRHPANPDVYYDTAATIITLILVGRTLEGNAMGRTSAAIRGLMNLAPATANVIREGRELEMPVEMLRVGDRIAIRPGQRLPVDGTVVEGRSSVDESAITGESRPVSKSAGASVTSGSVSLDGYLEVEAVRVGQETALAQIVRLVESAQASKASVQRLADRVSSVFVPIVIVLAVATLLVHRFVIVESWSLAMLPAVAVLVIACPCALGLATPTAIIVGTGRGAELGILIRDGSVVERAGKIRTVLLDKTGTITDGTMRVSAKCSVRAMREAEWMPLAAAAEVRSEHPIGRAIAAQIPDPPTITDFEAVRGGGVRAQIGTTEVLVGTPALFEESGLLVDHAVRAEYDRIEASGASAVLVGVNSQVVGVIGVMDQPRLSSQDAIMHLKWLGIRVVMVTGDQPVVARGIADQVDIEEVEARVLPHEKAEIVRRFQESGPVAMVGDGINDAPALAQANLGIAMGSGTDVAMNTADITLMRPDLRLVPTAIGLARATMNTIRRNLVWAFGYNVVMIPLAMAGRMNPMWAAGAMAFSSVSVVLNSLQLRRFRAQGEA